MTEEALFQLVQQFIDTPEGQKLIKEVGIDIDIESIQKKIKALDTDLSREDRRKNRKDKREKNKNIRIQNRIDRKAKRKQEIRQLRAQLKGNIPTLRQFTIKGRLFNKNTGDPLEGVEIKALKAIIFKGGPDGRKELRDQKKESREKRREINKKYDNLIEKQKPKVDDEKERNKTTNFTKYRQNASIIREQISREELKVNPDNNLITKLQEKLNEAFRDSEFYEDKELNKLKELRVKRTEETAALQFSKYTTDKNGNFEAIVSTFVFPAQVTIKVDDDDDRETEKEEETFDIRSNDIVLLKPQLLYTQPGFVPTTQEIVNLNNNIKSDLSTKALININVEAKRVKNEIVEEINEGKKKIAQLALSLPEAVVVERRKQIMKITNTITGKLIPLLIGLLISFGITKLTQKNLKICPTPDILRENIKRRNRVVRQLNQIYLAIGLNVTLAALFIVIASVLKSAKDFIDSLAIPLISQPYTTVSKLDNIGDLLKELEEQNKDLNKQTLIALVFLVAAVIAVLVLLKGLDELTEECAGEEDLEFEPINQELQDLTEEQAEEGFPLVTEVNGFIMGIELEKNTVGSLKRRFATAKNKQGVIQLKGEPSFSATDQILIDELAFYITSNNLKAF